MKKLRHYIAMDLAVSHTTVEVQTNRGEVVRRLDIPTESKALVEAVKSVPGPRGLTFEESTMADWVYRLLRPYMDEIVVCNPRENRLVCEGDKDDSVDPGKLCRLYRLGELKAVHHPARRSTVDLRRWVWLYNDQVCFQTGIKNKIKAAYRFYGIQYRNNEPYDSKKRDEFLRHLPTRAAREQLLVQYRLLDHIDNECGQLRRRLERAARRHPVIKTFLEVPGFGVIRSVTFFVIVDTPWRFATVNKLWGYAGLGIHRKKSGKAKAGKPYSNGPEHLNWPFNPRLKNVAKGAATTVIGYQGNAFREKYEQLIADGIEPSKARNTVARKCLAVPWAMWKTGARYRPQEV